MTTLQDMLRRRRGSGTASAKPRARQHFGIAPVSEDPAPSRQIRVVILTYERPGALELLLNDLDQHRGDHELSVVVYDDASRADYSAPRRILEERGWDYVRAPKNHGKRRFWQWVRRIYGDQRSRPEATFVMLPDDMRLCSDFFDRALNVWIRITDPDKVALNLLRDNSRDGSACWTKQRPVDAGPVFDTGWVDGAILCNRRYFKELGWTVQPVDPQRWAANSQSSSGVGQQLSTRLFGKRMGMYGVKRSLIAHVAGPSQMNAIERRRNPLLAMHFIDGDDAHLKLTGVAAPSVHPKRLVAVRGRKLRRRRLFTSTKGAVKKR